MVSLLPTLMLWAQAGPGPAGPRPWLDIPLQWLLVFGDPMYSVPGLLGSLITWLKIVGLLTLMGWVGSRVLRAAKEGGQVRLDWLSIAALAALAGLIGTSFLQVLVATQRVRSFGLGGIPLTTVLATGFGLVLLAWVEKLLWTTVGRVGHKSDPLVLIGAHLALVLGFFAALGLLNTTLTPASFPYVLASGARLGATYMGFVALIQLALILSTELAAIRWRRLYSIANFSILEANRRMWAPYVVLVIFGVILAFTHWFLQAPRAAEMGRLYVGMLTLLCSLLLTVMVTILSSISLPNDIRQQTIYTIVSKPVRRLELIWGRLIGYMGLVTVMIAIFGGISLFYLSRTVGGTISKVDEDAKKYTSQNLTTQAKAARDQADQLRTRMSARVPVKGSLTFLDSLGKPHYKGIDVGQETERRSFVEGATPSAAIWVFGVVPDPIDPKLPLDRRIPVDQFLRKDTIEDLQNRRGDLLVQTQSAEQAKGRPDLPAAESSRLTTAISRNMEEVKGLDAQIARMVTQSADLLKKADADEAAGKAADADKTRRDERALHSPDVPAEMTFSVYRTTKGIVGDPVYASIQAVNPVTNARFEDTFAIREYYTNKLLLPATLLAGSQGALRIEVRCLSPTQYLGMAESDLYLVAPSGTFGWNFLKGLFGVWLQAMVLTAIGVFAGSFLSWPVALLLTIAFFVAGQMAFGFLQEFALKAIQMQGGGPFESLIRLLSHENLVNDLSPTMAVVVAKTLDSLVLPVMSRLVYIVPNFTALDVSNTVAEGYAVGGRLLLENTLMALAYALPFTIAGYFILKNREVAA
ncbi:hypothetical protein EP7_004614 [Isosphaeraceae bacterium EP7]